MSDPIEHFRLAIAAAGLEAPNSINPDGAIHRFSTSGRRGDDSGWYVLHTDGMAAGAFGCWRTGRQFSWCAKEEACMTDAERENEQQRIKVLRAQREAQMLITRQMARETAALLWCQATAMAVHPYLSSKGVQPNGLRVRADKLLIPVQDTAGTLHSLQSISTRGDKRFLQGGRVKGCYHRIVGQTANRLVIAEGYATGASIHEATGDTVAVAFNAGNMWPVAKAINKSFPALTLVIAADDDHLTPGNPGMEAAKRAALAVGAFVVVPQFAAGRPGKATDFNDLAALAGLRAVRECFEIGGIHADLA